MDNTSTFIRATISLREDQKVWLHIHPEYSLSGICQKAVDEIISREIGSKDGKLTLYKEVSK